MSITTHYSLLQNCPVPMALLGQDFSFIDFSEEWLRQFNLSTAIKGKSIFDCMPELPEELRMDITYCLEGLDQRTDVQRILSKNGDAVWYEWKISPSKTEDGDVNGVILILEDVTEKKFKESFYLKSQEVARIGAWEVDLIKNTVFWSKITKEIHEVPQDYVPDIEKGISFYKEGKSRETITRLVKDCIENGKPWDTELQIVTANGKDVWVKAIGEPEILNGKCIRINGTFQDIDKRKKAELQYTQASDRLALATKTAGIGIWEFDIPNNEVLWDANMYKLYGIEESEFAGVIEAWEACLFEEDLKEVNRAYKDALNGIKEFETIYRIKWPNGEVRWIKSEATVIKNEEGIPVKMVGVNDDITELKNTQLELVQSEESLQGAFENSSVGMALVATDGKFIQVNQSLCKSLGYTEEELLKLTFQDITHPDDLEIDLSMLYEVIDGKRSTYQIEKRYFGKNGQLVHVFLTVTSVRKINGELSHFISQIVDISSRIKAENKLKGLLQVTTNQNNSLINFAHIVSHNLRSHAANLSMITGFLVEDELSEEEQVATLGMLERASGGLNETITHLNEVVQVKLSSEKKLKVVSLGKTVNKVLKDVAALINENQVQVSVNVSPDHMVNGVIAYIESIILNLVTNAIKYRDTAKMATVFITSVVEDEFVVMKVSDNGLGIDMDKYGEKLFGMYKTFHHNKDARGIGLFITKNQIEAMGGSIMVDSEVGKGTTFKVKFAKG
ncbi:PAS domain-containing sensor histidine kinase [Flagellimonas zhangzhouensis]|uniref:histidine kinase n=1 Tax=Flagellimonas zhangzhouensis TaxID=1073328 RepID=A0A1H2U9G5_9FLAO|nr:PAS domain S-box protein [Allomuricauda zhangzhouensis]SDQ18903.1 PAS domain S-box-containing protein [Allomuricauda zhangzhouensis]SDW52853.1 PAS domain S-box-containing protein [Allomuricauda zhangzhouensis]